PDHLLTLHSFPTRRSSDLHTQVPDTSQVAADRGLDDARSSGRGAPATVSTPGTRPAARLCEGHAKVLLIDGLLDASNSKPSRSEDRKSTRLNSSHRTISYA